MLSIELLETTENNLPCDLGAADCALLQLRRLAIDTSVTLEVMRKRLLIQNDVNQASAGA